ncbi:hypothetical protein BD410DRAFT_432045 [Rickenella mellea]|uniref:Uncharacterized protein n=1 Tax=Rickenella mellea TaxID=50990 RepID=A0A4Y7PWV7_9AGAM|nr:hypothetical protein BD410DRAFT_432045 [Rickenella mellea]
MGSSSVHCFPRSCARISRKFHLFREAVQKLRKLDRGEQNHTWVSTQARDGSARINCGKPLVLLLTVTFLNQRSPNSMYWPFSNPILKLRQKTPEEILGHLLSDIQGAIEFVGPLFNNADGRVILESRPVGNSQLPKDGGKQVGQIGASSCQSCIACFTLRHLFLHVS